MEQLIWIKSLELLITQGWIEDVTGGLKKFGFCLPKENRNILGKTFVGRLAGPFIEIEYENSILILPKNLAEKSQPITDLLIIERQLRKEINANIL